MLSCVPQDTVHGPLLFFLFIGYINARIQHGNALSFANDTRTRMKIKQPKLPNKLQENLKAVYRWPENICMIFNAGKFQRVSYGVSPPNPVNFKPPNDLENQTNRCERSRRYYEQ